jgi:hypothetical protein
MVLCRGARDFPKKPGSQGFVDLLRILGFREFRWIDATFILPHDEGLFRLQREVLRVYGHVLLSPRSDAPRVLGSEQER